jgi:hypothetical protein
MSTLSAVRGGIIGVAAVAAPAIVTGVAEIFIIRGLWPFFGLLCVAFVFVGGLAWACVRVAHFPRGLAVFLTTLPFSVLTLMTLYSLGTGNAGPFLFCFGQLALAVFVAWTAARLAMLS